MMGFQKIWRSNFLIKLRSWEYWPFGLVYAPVFISWIWYALRARSFLYFTASNPSIENGGMLGESKMKIFDLIPDKYKPITLLFEPATPFEEIQSKRKKANLTYPLIAKPDVGERGWLVQKINNDEELIRYTEKIPVCFLLQEYIDLPYEMGIFYYRYPNAKQGRVSSIVIKEMLKVVGDDTSTLKELILSNDRAKLQWAVLKNKYRKELDLVLTDKEEKELIGIGNHCRGAKFLNGNDLINNELNNTFDLISHQIPDFYFGRYDIRVKSYDDLYKGNIKIMELNGAGSEPAHIYQPGFSIWKAYQVIFHHWHVLFEISVLNRKRGIPYLSLAEGWREYKKTREIGKE